MPRSKTFLIDANVWLALASERHEHDAAARNWFMSLGEGEAAFCRITQMTLLRLLTSPAVISPRSQSVSPPR
jgi:predicted nucleic acid-binding protein